MYLTGRPDNLVNLQAIVNPEYTDVDADVDAEEQETLTEDMADYLQSIID
jgi:hypothetical protein